MFTPIVCRKLANDELT